ncbi:MAG: RNA polymerase sigma factor [Bacteroidetes bacterium]|nr:RNA polymerase sigma factor [Bacteroidota bacterium]
MDIETIYFEYSSMVYNLSLQYVQNTEDAEEITQDVFVKVYQKLPSFQEKSSLRTWVYRIAINQSLDFIKAKQSLKRRFWLNIFSLNDEKYRFDPVDFQHPGVELEQKEACKRIFDAINQLPDKQKTSVILLKIMGKDRAEVAEIMNLNVKAMESVFQRAKKNLEVLLNKNNSHEKFVQ